MTGMAILSKPGRKEPNAFQALWDLRPLQNRLVCETELAGRRGWAVDVGYGKTLAAMMVIRWSPADHVLWCGPKNAAFHAFPAEVAKWNVIDPKSVRVLTSEDFNRAARYDFDGRRVGVGFEDKKATKARILALAQEFRVLVCSYDWLDALAEVLGATRLFDLVVWDEAQYLKRGGRQGSQRFKAANHLGKGARQMIALSATPQTASFEELWALAFLVDHGARLGATLTEFRDRYMKPDRNGHTYSIRDEIAEHLVRSEFAQLWTGVRDDERMQLPDLNVIDHWVPVPADAHRAATKLMRGLLAQVGDATILPANVAAGLEKALQMIQGFSYQGDGETRKAVQVHKEKFEALEELLESGITGGILLFYRHRDTAEKLRKLLGTRAGFINDGDDQIERWNRGEFQTLAGHPASMSEGLNLQHGGNTIIFFGVPWSLNHYVQAIGRMHRSGQTKPVFVHRILADHPVERAVVDSLEGNGQLLDLLKLKLGEEQ